MQDTNRFQLIKKTQRNKYQKLITVFFILKYVIYYTLNIILA